MIFEQALLEKKADMHAINDDGDTALSLGRASGNETIVRLLRDARDREASSME